MPSHLSLSTFHLCLIFASVSYKLTLLGDDGLIEYHWRVNKPRGKNKETEEESRLWGLISDCFRIYYPTRDTVVESKGGRGVSFLPALIAG